jgi:hypothetical protein
MLKYTRQIMKSMIENTRPVMWTKMTDDVIMHIVEMKNAIMKTIKINFSFILELFNKLF